MTLGATKNVCEVEHVVDRDFAVVVVAVQLRPDERQGGLLQ